MQESKSILSHPEWGKITVTRKPRARSIILRVRGGCIYATLPYQCPISKLEEILVNNRDKLLRQVAATQIKKIDWDYTLQAPFFNLSLHRSNENYMRITGENGVYTLYSPATTDFSDNNRQQELRQAIKAALRHRAKQILPQRLAQLAAQHSLKYTSANVRDSHSRWGSCSTRGSISLSIYLVLLPIELIDYVLRHELCHTVHMNHSQQFWALLDKLCCTSSKRLCKQLKEYRTDF